MPPILSKTLAARTHYYFCNWISVAPVNMMYVKRIYVRFPRTFGAAPSCKSLLLWIVAFAVLLRTSWISFDIYWRHLWIVHLSAIKLNNRWLEKRQTVRLSTAVLFPQVWVQHLLKAVSWICTRRDSSRAISLWEAKVDEYHVFPNLSQVQICLSEPRLSSFSFFLLAACSALAGSFVLISTNEHDAW